MSTNFQWNNVTFVTLCVNKCLKDKSLDPEKNIVCRNLGKAGELRPSWLGCHFVYTLRIVKVLY